MTVKELMDILQKINPEAKVDMECQEDHYTIADVRYHINSNRVILYNNEEC